MLWRCPDRHSNKRPSRDGPDANDRVIVGRFQYAREGCRWGSEPFRSPARPDRTEGVEAVRLSGSRGSGRVCASDCVPDDACEARFAAEHADIEHQGLIGQGEDGLSSNDEDPSLWLRDIQDGDQS